MVKPQLSIKGIMMTVHCRGSYFVVKPQHITLPFEPHCIVEVLILWSSRNVIDPRGLQLPIVEVLILWSSRNILLSWSVSTKIVEVLILWSSRNCDA